jgi:transposase IS116/IS110/IS902 family protein
VVLGRFGGERNQVEGWLEQGSIKLTAVVSDVFGVSGWAMLEKIAQGVIDEKVWVAEARGVLRRKEEELKEALGGRLEPVYRMLLKQYMDQVRLLRKQVEEINQALALALKEHLPALHRLTQMPGVDLHAAQELLAEIGPRAAAFPSAEQFASWVGVSRQSRISRSLLQPPLSQGEPLSETFAVPDCVGGSAYQRNLLRGFVCPAQTPNRRQGRSVGSGPSDGQGHLAGAAQPS